jgi:hypothetical protein
MLKSKRTALLLAIALLGTSCTATSTTIHRGALAPPAAVKVVVKEDASGDSRIRAALDKGFLERGLVGGSREVVAEFEDTWHWDIVMYLRFLHVRFIDAKSGQLFGDASWRQRGLHVYPSQESAVKELFEALDKAGAFDR